MDNMAEAKQEEQKPEYNAGFTDEGFFTCYMHESKGVRELLGFLEQCKDVVKQHYVKKMMEDAKAKGLIRPDGLLNGFRNKWRR